MKKILMHKDVPVAKINIMGGTIFSIEKILNLDHMPVGTRSDYPNLYARLLSSWNEMRSIPKERQNVDKIEHALGCSVSEAKVKSMAVSLTDCYWLNDLSSPLTWESVNYHSNGFSSNFSDFILWNNKMREINCESPDFTTDGALEKTWISLDGIPTLLKFGDLGPNTNGRNLLSANEVVASKVAELMGIEHVTYYPIKLEKKDEIICACDCFIQDDKHEFINALQILKSSKNAGGVNLYHTFKSFGMKKDIDRMILLDHILHNTDRHEKNFGIIRDASSLEILQFAPLFDSGSCLGWNRDGDYIAINDMKPFSSDRMMQLSLSDYKMSSLPEKDMVKHIVQETYEQFYIPESCYGIACNELDFSYEMALNNKKSYPAPNIEEYER